MSNAVLDDNLRRIFHRCAPPRLTEADLDRALARFEGRKSRAPALAAAAAAILLIGVMSWFAVTPPTPAQEKAADIERLIAELASPETREKARSQLIAIGVPALGPLERALYHENPDVRVESQAITKTLRRAAEIQPSLAFVRAAIKIARARWVARDFTDFVHAIHQAFDPNVPSNFRYVPRKTIAENYDTREGKEKLTPDMVAELERNDGVLFLDDKNRLTDFGETVIFTLPDKVGWTAYVVVGLQYFNLDGRMNRGVNVAEGEVEAYFQASTLAPQPGGGLKIVDADLKSNIGQMLKKGDILRAVNDAPLTTLEDLRPHAGPGKAFPLTIDRDGKVFSIRINVLENLKPLRELDARTQFNRAEAALAKDPAKALQLYKELLSRYGSTSLVKEEKAVIEKRIAELEAKPKQK